MTKMAAMRSGTLPTDSGPQASSTSDIKYGSGGRGRGATERGRKERWAVKRSEYVA